MRKIIHRFWGGKAMPDNYKGFGDKWAELNPDWDVILWEPRWPGIAVPNYISNPSGKQVSNHLVINKTVWNMLNTPPEGMRVDEAAMWTQRADVLGYELVYKYGGLYVNTDIEPVRPLSDLFSTWPHLYTEDAAAMEDDQWLVNAVLWAPKSHSKFYEFVIKTLPKRYISMPGEYMNVTTGPHLLTACAYAVPDLLAPIDKEVFSHVHWSQVESGKDAVVDYDSLPSDVIGIHHWGHRKSGRPQTSWV
jgi:mannosyltransferase OCH1-like enzyme